jgi:hypothetical protein
MIRRYIAALITLPATLAATVLKPKNAHDIVRQTELQELLDLHRVTEILTADIRRRLEAGAALEDGPLTASGSGSNPLTDSKLTVVSGVERAMAGLTAR